jgi:uncharacterized protein (DUF427 family)
MKATSRGRVLAESHDTVVAENNYYFLPHSVNGELVRESSTHTTCSWKGQASYYDVIVDGDLNKDAAGVCPEPKNTAKETWLSWLSGKA